MKKVDLLNRLIDAGVVAVIRSDSARNAIKLADAVIAGDVTGIELTFTVPNADQAISTLVQKYVDDPKIIVGAGTVIDPISARIAIINGAEFIVSPSFNSEVAKICNLYSIPYVPGCLTPTEIQYAMEAGVDIVKLFPGSITGPAMVKAIKAPFPNLNIMPTGGVNLDNMADWFKAGVTLIGAGSNLTAGAQDMNYGAVTNMAKKYHQVLLDIKK